jgi:sarcosine oxidase, subunit beta
MSTYDIAIIGAGVHGAAAAFHLTGRGLRVAVFERFAPAGGPTGRSSAICRAYYTNPFLARCARDSIEMMADFRQRTGVDAELRRTGFLYLHGPSDVASMSASAAALNGLGVAVDVLAPDELAARFPQLDLSGIGAAAWERHAGYADPASVTHGLFRRAVELGVESRLGQSVSTIALEDGGGATLVVRDDRIRCDRLLVAAGPWTRPLLSGAGVDLPLTVERHIVGTYRWGDAERAPAHGDLLGGYYLRPEGTELFIAGYLHPAEEVDPDAFRQSVTDDELHELAALFVRRVPGLEVAEVHSGWASLYDVSPDWQPVIGEVAPGVYVDAGTSGHGFKLAPALGRHVADLVAGEEPDPGLKQFHPERFTRDCSLAAGYGQARILG